MKKNLLTTLALCLLAFSSTFAQKIAENKKDDFTGTMMKRTTWESFSTTFSTTLTAYIRVSQLDQYMYFDLKLMLGKVFSMDKDAELMFKLDNGEVITLQNYKYAITCEGCGATGLKGSQAPGIETSFRLSKENADKLKANKVVKVRIMTTDGYVENEVKEKFAEVLQKEIALIQG